MATIGGPHSAFEKNFEARMVELEKSIAYRTGRITKILEDAYTKPTSKAIYWSAVRKKLDVEYKAMNRVYVSWARVNIPKAYKYSVAELMTRLNRSRTIARKAKQTYSTLVTSNKSIGLVNVLYRDATASWASALKSGQSNLNRITRATRQALLKESLLDISVARAIESGNLMNNTFIKSINMSNTLASQLDAVAEVIDGKKYIVAGSRRFTPKYYAEMVSRVKFHEAQAYGAIQTGANYGTSLMQVSAHNTTTAICVPYEGKIFSVDGKDERFERLDDIPPYHTNCLHLLFPMFASSMELDGTINQWSEFSKGKIDTPPSPANFIPVKDREGA